MSVEYRGKKFPGYNKPIKSDREGKKKMVLAKSGDVIDFVYRSTFSDGFFPLTWSTTFDFDYTPYFS